MRLPHGLVRTGWWTVTVLLAACAAEPVAGEGTTTPAGTGCVPTSCADQQAACGKALDGCGKIILCGACDEGLACGAGGPNVCGAGTCVPTTCQKVGADCGLIPDNCGEVLDCGSCPTGMACGLEVLNRCASTTHTGGSGGAGAGGESGPSGNEAGTAGQDASVSPGSSGAGGSAPGVTPTQGPRVGMWISPWVLGMLSPSGWVDALHRISFATSHPNRPVVVLGICGAATQTTTQCLMDKPAGVPDAPNVEYFIDYATPIMDAIEADGGIDVILDVEVMQARVSDVMRAVMTKYAGYESVVGFSPDWEWVYGDPDKASKIPSWIDELHQYKPGTELHLISWDTSVFGSYRSDDLSFGYDGQGVSGMQDLLSYYQGWSDAFSPYRRGWYWGYASDWGWLEAHCQSAEGIRDVQDAFLALNPDAMLLLASEHPFFHGGILDRLPTQPMWQ